MKIIERLAVLAVVACCAAFAEARQMPEVQLAVGQDAKLVFQEIRGIRELGAMYPTEGNAVDVKWTKGEKAVNLVGVAAGTETLLVKGTDLEGNSDLFVYSLNVGSGTRSEKLNGLGQTARNDNALMDYTVSSTTVDYNGQYHKFRIDKVYDSVTRVEIKDYKVGYNLARPKDEDDFVPEDEFKGVRDAGDPNFGIMVYIKITANGYNDKLGSVPFLVLPRTITVKALDGEKVFDADPTNPETYAYEFDFTGYKDGDIKDPRGVVPGEGTMVSNLLFTSGGKFNREAGEDVNEDPGYLITNSVPFVANDNYMVKCETAHFKIHPRPIKVIPPGEEPPAGDDPEHPWAQAFSVTNAYNGLGTNIVVKYGNIFNADGSPATDVDIVYSVDKSFAPQYIVPDNWRTNVTGNAENPLLGTNVWFGIAYGDNYIGTNAFAEVVITQRVLTVEAADTSKSYGEKDPYPFAWTLPHADTDVVKGEKAKVYEAVSNAIDLVRFNSEDKTQPPEEDAGKYAGVISTNGPFRVVIDDTENYRVDFVPGDFEITGGHSKYDMYGAAGDWIGVYDGVGHTIRVGVDPERNRTRDGVVHQTQVRFSTDEKASWTDWIDWTNCYENANLIPRFTDVVDRATIWVQAKNEPNYPDVIETNATVTITQRVISVTAEDARKKYGEDDPAFFDFTYDLTSAKEIGEEAYVKGCLDMAKGSGLIVFKRAAGEDVLPDGKGYAITNEVAFAGPCLSNYRVVYNPGEFLIDRDDITVVPPPPEERPEGAATPYDYIDVYKGQERGYTIRFMLDPEFAAKEPHGKTQVQFSLDGSDWSEPTDYIDSLDADYGDLIPKFTNVTDGARKVWVKATNEPNYNETNFYGFVTITQRVVTVTAPHMEPEPEAPLPTTADLFEALTNQWDDLVVGTIPSESGKDAGVIKVDTLMLEKPGERVNQQIFADGLRDQGNYLVEYKPSELQYKPKIDLTIYLGETNVLFGAAVPDFTWDNTTNGVVDCEETVKWNLVTTDTAEFVTTYEQFSPVGGDYPITVKDGTLTSDRYNITVVPGKVIVSKRPITDIPPGEDPPTEVDPEQPWAKAYSVTNGYNGLGTNIVVKYGNIFGTDGVEISAALTYYTPDKEAGIVVPDNWCTNATGNAANPLRGTNVVCNVASIDNYIDCDVSAEVVITQLLVTVTAPYVNPEPEAPLPTTEELFEALTNQWDDLVVGTIPAESGKDAGVIKVDTLTLEKPGERVDQQIIADGLKEQGNYLVEYKPGTLTYKDKIPLTIYLGETNVLFGAAVPEFTWDGIYDHAQCDDPDEKEIRWDLITTDTAEFDTAYYQFAPVGGDYPITVKEGTLSSTRYVITVVPGKVIVGKRPITDVPPGEDPPAGGDPEHPWAQAYSVTNAYNGLGTNIVVKYGNIFGTDGKEIAVTRTYYTPDRRGIVVPDNWCTNATEDAEHPLRGTNVVCNVASVDNYIDCDVSAEVVITQRVLTVEAEDANKSYSEKDPEPFAWTLPHADTDVVEGEEAKVYEAISNAIDLVRFNSQDKTQPPEEDVGKYAGVISTNGPFRVVIDDTENYRVDFGPGDFEITGGHAKYDMYGEAGDWIGVYDGEGHTIDFGVDPESNRTRDGVVHQTQVRFSTDEKASWTDWIDWTNCYENANLIPRFTDVVDRATIWVQAKNEPNYPDVIETNATVTITQRVISVTAEDARKKYGEDDPAFFDFTYDLTSAKEIGEEAYVKGCLDTAKGSGLIVFKRAAGEDVLPDGKGYAITNEVAFAGPCLSNYRVVYNPGKFLIDRDDITVIPPPPEEQPEGAATPYDYIDVYKGQERGYTIRFMLDPEFAAKEPHGKTQVQFSLDGSDWSEPTDYIDSLDADYGDLIPKFTNVTDGARKVWVKATNEPNYNETNFYGFVTITQRVVTVKATNAFKDYGEDDPMPFAWSITNAENIVEGEEAKMYGAISNVLDLVRFNSEDKTQPPEEDVGEYMGVISTNAPFCVVIDDAENYRVDFVPGDFEITGGHAKYDMYSEAGDWIGVYDGEEHTILFGIDPESNRTRDGVVHQTQVRFSTDEKASWTDWIDWTNCYENANLIPRFRDVTDGAQRIWVQAKNEPNYPDVVETNATVTITQRVVVVTADSANKVYDGTPLTQPNWKVSKAEGHGFVDGEGFDVIAMTGDSTITNVGVRDNVIDVKTVTYNQKTNPNNYIFDYRHGTLEITPRPIVPGEPDDPPGKDSALAYAIKGEKVYDGQPTNITVGVKGIVEGEEGLVKMVYSETAPDESTVWLEDNPEYTDVAGNEEKRWVWCKVSAGDNYTTAVVSNYVLIKKRPVTLTSPTKTVSHDKIPLTFDETEVKDSPQGQSDAGYVDGERFAYSNFATNNTPGTSISATFKYANDTALVDNYRVTQVLGVLKVEREKPTPSPCGDVTQLVARVYQIQLNTYTTRGQAVDGGISGGGQCGEPTTNACVVMRGKDKTVIRGYVYICDDLCNLADYSSVFVDVRRNGYADTAATKLEWRFCNAIGVHSTDAEAAWTLTADFQYDDTRHQKYVLDGAGYGYAIWEASRLWIGNTLHFDDLTGYFAGLAEGSYDLKTPKSKIACACDRSQVLNCTNFGEGVDIGFVDSDTVAFGRWKMRYNDKLSVAYAEGKWNPISAIRNLIK